jgi:glycosyltransferase involved in cell wall biosynthesis
MNSLSLTRALDAPVPAEALKAGDLLTTIILPAYNEARALPTVLSALQNIVDERYEVLVVDDGSTDDTVDIVRAYPCRWVRHKSNRGKGAAVQTGIANARGRYLIVMDADATYPAEAIPRIVDLLADYDLVRCNRQSNGAQMPALNRAGNWIFDRLLAVAHGLDGTDHLSGLYGLRREAVLPMQLESVGFDIEAEIGIKARVKGLRVMSFPVAYQPRMGEKKLRPWRDGLRILSRITLLILAYNPLLTFILPGLVIMLLAFIGALILTSDRIVAPYFGLSIHSFIVATLGALAAFQLVVFGMAAALYSVEVGYQPPLWLMTLSSRRLRLGSALFGLALALVSAVEVFQLMARWVISGAGIFLATRPLVLASTGLVWGMQILSAALFLSIFAGRFERRKPRTPQADESEMDQSDV